ncbi:Ig-like domain-containing protein [Niabella sp. CJ426]|uniref:Ig-like domain-containing protein n=1 Tax=Niabella sp. CJ426 TaxID=3393740 RepID=UPI003D01B256
MSENKIFKFVAVFSLFSLLFAGCDKNMEKVQEVNVSGITLNEALKKDNTLLIGTTLDVSRQISVSPENATDRAENYTSSNPAVAAVSGLGIVRALSEGSAIITIAVGKGGHSVEVPITVVSKILKPATQINFRKTELDLGLGGTYNLVDDVQLIPFDANDDLVYTSSQPTVVAVNTVGRLEGLSRGTATVSVASKQNPSVKATVTVHVVAFSGDYPRAGWTMTASHALMIATGNPEGNSLAAAVDGDFATNFCLVRPGKSSGNATGLVTVPSGEAIHFTVDMKASQEVDYFRILHRNTTQVFIRWYAFDQILGSNDGANFEVIASNVVVPDAATGSPQESVDIPIPKSKYRYIRFYAQKAQCFYQSSYTSQGNTVQIQELYLGVK